MARAYLRSVLGTEEGEAGAVGGAHLLPREQDIIVDDSWLERMI